MGSAYGAGELVQLVQLDDCARPTPNRIADLKIEVAAVAG
jgi:hypothetical protein